LSSKGVEDGTGGMEVRAGGGEFPQPMSKAINMKPIILYINLKTSFSS
jgi:hypothetical protein